MSKKVEYTKPDIGNSNINGSGNNNTTGPGLDYQGTSNSTSGNSNLGVSNRTSGGSSQGVSNSTGSDSNQNAKSPKSPLEDNNRDSRYGSNGSRFGQQGAPLGKLDDQESNPEGPNNGDKSVAEQEEEPWKYDDPTNGNGKKSKSRGRFSFLKKKGPLVMISALTILIGGSTMFMGSVAPLAYIANVTSDLYDQLSATDARNMKMMRNKVPLSLIHI